MQMLVYTWQSAEYASKEWERTWWPADCSLQCSAMMKQALVYDACPLFHCCEEHHQWFNYCANIDYCKKEYT